MTEHDNHHQYHHKHADGTITATNKEAWLPRRIDPVCGMKVVKEGAEHVATFEGETYYFAQPGAEPVHARTGRPCRKERSLGHDLSAQARHNYEHAHQHSRS